MGVNTCLKMSVFHGPEMKGNILFKATSLENCCRTAKTSVFCLSALKTEVIEGDKTLLFAICVAWMWRAKKPRCK